MLGYVTDYDSKIDDSSLLRITREKDMILLTRDQELYDRAQAKNLASVLVTGEGEEETLAQLAEALGVSLNIDMARTRCPACGSEVQQIPKIEASHYVPEQSLKIYDQYWKCTDHSCAKIYWQGSHWKKIHQTLLEARKIAARPE